MVTNQKTARQTLGEVLRFHREQRSLTIRRVADMTGNGSRAVENFEAGHVVPDGKAWDKYTGIVNKRLRAYSELRQRALAEADADRALIIKSMEQRNMATATSPNGPTGTNGHNHSKPTPPLAHKPFSGLVGVALPEPAPDARTVNPGREVAYHAAPPKLDPAPPVSRDDHTERSTRTKLALAKLPRGWKSAEQKNKRRAFALELIRQRPGIRTHGADSLHEALVQTFGVGLGEPTIDELREQVRREKECEHVPVAQAAPLKPAPVQESISVTHSPGMPKPPPSNPHDPQAEIATAVSLVLEAIPNLRTFTISVDDQGEASVDYTMREVKVIETGGSLKVKR